MKNGRDSFKLKICGPMTDKFQIIFDQNILISEVLY